GTGAERLFHTTRYIFCAAQPREHLVRGSEGSENQASSKARFVGIGLPCRAGCPLPSFPAKMKLTSTHKAGVQGTQTPSGGRCALPERKVSSPHSFPLSGPQVR